VAAGAWSTEECSAGLATGKTATQGLSAEGLAQLNGRAGLREAKGEPHAGERQYVGEQHCGERRCTEASAGPRTEQDSAVKRYWQDRSEAGCRSVAGATRGRGASQAEQPAQRRHIARPRRLARDGVVSAASAVGHEERAVSRRW
jgi:hypothetical protein